MQSRPEVIISLNESKFAQLFRQQFNLSVINVSCPSWV